MPAPYAEQRAGGRTAAAVVAHAPDHGDLLPDHVLRQGRAEPRSDDHHGDGADAGYGARGERSGDRGTIGDARVRPVAGGTPARVHSAYSALDRVVRAARPQLAGLRTD